MKSARNSKKNTFRRGGRVRKFHGGGIPGSGHPEHHGGSWGQDNTIPPMQDVVPGGGSGWTQMGGPQNLPPRSLRRPPRRGRMYPGRSRRSAINNSGNLMHRSSKYWWNARRWRSYNQAPDVMRRGGRVRQLWTGGQIKKSAVNAVMEDWVKEKAQGEHTRKWKTGGRVNPRRMRRGGRVRRR